jgi:hypothetical protein
MTAPCLKCGEPGKLIEVTMDDQVICSHFSCQRCFNEAFADLEENRRQFQELLDAGVSNAEANRTMIARIGGEVMS